MSIYYKLFFLVLSLLTFGCMLSRVDDTQLHYKEYKYYEGKSWLPYSGKVFFKFPNSQQTSEYMTIKMGIPHGKWEAYGYQGETIQSGYHFPVILNDSLKLGEKKLLIKRVNYVFFSEGEYQELTVLIVVTNKLSVNSADSVLNHYIEKNRPKNKYINKLNISSTKIVDREF